MARERRQHAWNVAVPGLKIIEPLWEARCPYCGKWGYFIIDHKKRVWRYRHEKEQGEIIIHAYSRNHNQTAWRKIMNTVAAECKKEHS